VTKRYQLTLKAQSDLQDIWMYIARDNSVAADRVDAAFYDMFETLAKNPYMGHKRDELTQQPVCFWPVFSYQIVYDPESSPLTILRILSGYRDIESILND
jgi:plasmid stabilization system protein ParE